MAEAEVSVELLLVDGVVALADGLVVLLLLISELVLPVDGVVVPAAALVSAAVLVPAAGLVLLGEGVLLDWFIAELSVEGVELLAAEGGLLLDAPVLLPAPQWSEIMVTELTWKAFPEAPALAVLPLGLVELVELVELEAG